MALNKSLRIVLAFAVSFASAFFLLYFFPNSVASQLNTVIFFGYQFVFPSPQGSVYYDTLYSIPVGFVGIVPILLIADGDEEE